MSVGIPSHVAIIMDGNGRWARKRGLPRSMGHRQGAEAARAVVRVAAKIGVKYITLFGFSAENWSRPAEEIAELMKLLRHYLRSETADLHKDNARVRVIGDRTGFDADIVQLIEQAESLTRENTGICVVMALNYGGRQDIMQAARKLAAQTMGEGALPDQARTEALMRGFMMTEGIPDPDLLIRTSGEMRISNFLLWQCAYTELVFSPVLWPDFGEKEFVAALSEYSGRERRFGAVLEKQA